MPRFLLLCEIAGKLLALGWWMKFPWSFVGFGFFLAPDLLVLYHLLIPNAQGVCRVFTRFETTRPEIWLTIDDGPDPEDTPRILDLLARHGARATFFVIGERAARFPDLVRAIQDGGHELGHHTETHPKITFWCATRKRVARELDLTLSTLGRAGVRPTRYRSPVGIKNLFLSSALLQRSMRCVGWSIRSFDAGSTDPARVLARIRSQLTPGSILLMHEGPTIHPRVRVRAIELLLQHLGEKQIKCVIPTDAQLR